MILITGGDGQLGSCLEQTMKEYAMDVIAPGREQMDITNPEATANFFAKYDPTAVIHCAAYSKVDLAEEEPERCYRVNVYGTQVIADLCRKYGSYLLYISTDYVFDGKKQGGYEVFDDKHPLSVYGKTKSEGEDIVLKASSDNAILRTAWLFGHTQNNFVEAILRKARNNPVLNVVCDQIGTPTYTEDLSKLIVEIVKNRNAGIYHGTSEGECSWAQFAEKILAETGGDSQVSRVSSQMYGAKARRPKNSVLNKRSLDDAGLKRLPHWEDALKRYLEKRKNRGEAIG